MQLNDSEREWYEDLCGQFMACEAVPKLVYETFLPLVGGAVGMLTFLEGASDEQWAEFLREFVIVANEHGPIKADALMFKAFEGASPSFSRIWELLSAYAPQADAGDDDGRICFGLTSSEEPVFHLPHGYVQRANDGTESAFLFERNKGSWIMHRIESPEILFLASLLMLIRHANLGSEDPMALATLREFFVTAWKKRRDDAKARFEDAQYVVPCEGCGAHLYRQLQVFSFGEGALRRNYRVRRVYPAPNLEAHMARFRACISDFEERHSFVLNLGVEPEDAFFFKRDPTSFLRRSFLDIVEEILCNNGLDQVLFLSDDVLCLFTHERLIEES